MVGRRAADGILHPVATLARRHDAGVAVGAGGEPEVVRAELERRTLRPLPDCAFRA